MRRDFSDAVISKIDKDRRSGAAKARDARVTSDARMATAVSILKIPAVDKVRHCKGVLEAVREALTATLDHAGASSIIAAEAQQAIIAGPNARARAEQLFAANDAASPSREKP